MTFLRLKKSNCKNCYKCIRNCPVKAIRFSGGQAHIIDNECIQCGHCFVVCPQDAKEIVSSVEAVKVLIASGAPVYVSIAPSFVANYDGVGIEAVEEALMKLGFAGVEETAVGATIVKREYERLLQEEGRDVLISSCCPSVNLLIRKHFPSVVPFLADVVSPMTAHCQDMKRRHEGCKTVFIGPCLAKKGEADEYEDGADEVLTFEELSDWMRQEGIQFEKKKTFADTGLARLFPTTGGVLKTMACDREGYAYLAIDGVDNCMAALQDIAEGKIHRCFIEMSACVGSCINGPVMEKYHASPVHGYARVVGYAGKQDFDVEQPAPAVLRQRMEVDTTPVPMPSELEIADILRQMGKTQPEHQLNCGSCGYNSCREKAIAVFQGKAEISMCLPYLQGKAEDFLDTIINNTSMGILVLSENLEVQRINRAAQQMMNIRHQGDVLGEPVVRIMDPKDFMQVKLTCRSIRDKRIYLAEYDRYVEETITYDAQYRLFILMLRDVSREEEEREKKELIRARTVETADRVVDRQMRVIQEIASLLGETAAETKIALAKLKESIGDE